jgi:hypothetical protein
MLAVLCITTMAAIFPALRGRLISADGVITGGAWLFGLYLLVLRASFALAADRRPPEGAHE